MSGGMIGTLNLRDLEIPMRSGPLGRGVFVSGPMRLPESCLTVERLTPRLDSEQAYFVSTQDRRAHQPNRRRKNEGRGRLAIMTLVSLFIMSPMADFQAFSSLSISAR